MTYKINQPPFTLNFREMSTGELGEYGRWFHNIVPDRIFELSHAVRSTPKFENWEPDKSPESLSPLGNWFADQVATRNRSGEEMCEIKLQSMYPIDVSEYELTNRTFSLAMDTGMYFGQVVLHNLHGTRWDQLLTDKKFADYGQPIITGFGKVPLNPVHIVVVFAYGVARGTKRGDRLRELYDVWAKMKK